MSHRKGISYAHDLSYSKVHRQLLASCYSDPTSATKLLCIYWKQRFMCIRQGKTEFGEEGGDYWV